MDKLITAKEFLTQKLNIWNERLIERTAFYHEASLRLKENPRLVVQTQHQGKVAIAEVVEMRINAVTEARAWVKTLEDMLKEEAEGTLAARWSDDQIKNPMVESDADALGVRRKQ